MKFIIPGGRCFLPKWQPKVDSWCPPDWKDLMAVGHTWLLGVSRQAAIILSFIHIVSKHIQSLQDARPWEFREKHKESFYFKRNLALRLGDTFLFLRSCCLLVHIIGTSNASMWPRPTFTSVVTE